MTAETQVLIQAMAAQLQASMTYNMRNPMLQALLEHYAALVEQLTGTPAADTLAQIKAAAEPHETAVKEELARIITTVIRGNEPPPQ